ncbi:MAG: acyltransferase [Bacteroidota bacterium]|nr:acyltransferase [Bacteroidota bacterium]
MKKQHIASLTGIRFFLALWVLLFHTCDVWRDYPFIYALLGKGYIAVSAFFVLSGFILVYNYESLNTDSRSIKMFFLSRLIRLYPMYLLSIILALPLFVYYEYRTSIGYIAVVFITTVTTFLGIQAWYKPLLNKLNPPSWSLSVEFFFYSIFPFLNKALRSLSKSKLILLIAISFLISFVLMKDIVNSINSTKFINQFIQTGAFPPLHIFTFITGMCFGYLYYVHGAPFFRNYSDIISFSLILFFVFSLVYNWFSFVDINNGGYAIFFSIFFISISHPGSIIGKLLSNRFIVLLGESSYSFYILHLVVYAYLKHVAEKIFGYTDFESFSFLFFYLLITVTISVLSFLKIEKKLTIYFRKKFFKPFNAAVSQQIPTYKYAKP